MAAALELAALPPSSQLTAKFFKACSQSEWAEMPGRMRDAYENNDLDAIQRIVERFAEMLTKEEELYTQGKAISDCALFSPRVSSTFDKSSRPLRIAQEIAKKMYLITGQAKCLVGATMLYGRMVSALTKHCLAGHRAEAALAARFSLERKAQHTRKGWCELKKRPLTEAVTEPRAMPVDIAPEDEIQPFLQFLGSNQAPVENVLTEHCMRFVRGALYTDRRMDLCKQVVGPTWIEELMFALKENTHVEHFLLGNNIIGPKGGRAIGEFLLQPHTPRIKTWYLAGNELDHEGMSCIADGLIDDTDCTQLWLKRNPLKPQGAEHVGRLLAHNNHIRVLDLHNTAIFDTGLSFVMDGLRENTSLEFLYLDANGITAMGVDALVQYFEHLIAADRKGVHSLFIGMNNLGDDGVIKLVRVLAQYKHLERLNLDSTCISEVAAAEVCEAFKDHPSLIMLGLGMYKSSNDMGLTVNNLGDAGLQAVLPLLQQNRKLQHVSIIMNGISHAGIEALADTVDKTDTLMYIEYAQYDLKIDPQLNARIKRKLLANREAADFTTSARHIRHTPDIHWIDSIYRNAM